MSGREDSGVPPAGRRAVSMRRLLAVALACGLACTLAGAMPMLVPAGADVFEPIALVSQGTLGGGATQQAEYAHDPAISGDGQYLAFDGSIGGVTGVWRRDLATGQLEQVAGGDAELPSISANGEYVSFTTNEGASLAEITDGRSHEPSREAVQVYVRDMSVAPTAAGAFAVASAVDGSEEPLAYAGGSTGTGATAVGRSAIDAAGDEVAFVTTAVSNLVRYPKDEEEAANGETPKPYTPKLQVVVRYLRTHETVLVSRCYVVSKCEAAVAPAVASEENGHAYGAVYPGQSTSFEAPPPYGAYSYSPPPGASLSADGSTVAWIGEDVGQQAALLAEETRNPNYTEPLWRRIAPGSETATERVTGGSDPTNPACAASGERSLPATASSADPCQGPFIVEEQGNPRGIINENGGQTGDFVPRLSEHGNLVAFVSQAPLVSSGENFGRSKAGQESDLYVANMQPGLTRDQALTQLTELGGGEGAGLADTAPIFDFDISPDGSQVAFATVRTRFPLGFPAFVSTPAGEPGMNELSDADLADGTLTRVTHGYGGPEEASEHPHQPTVAGEDPYKQQPGDGALSPSFTSDGDVLAFSSTASNLVFGDGNTPPLGLPQTGSFDGADAFVVSRVLFGATPTPNYASETPGPALAPVWNLGVSALSRANGSVLLYVRAPGAGTLRAGAQSAVVIQSPRAERRGRRAAAAAARLRERGRLATRTVASGETTVGEAGLTTLTLALAPVYRSLAGNAGGLSATVTLMLAVQGHPTLRARIPVTFLREHKRANARAHKRGRHPAKKGGRA